MVVADRQAAGGEHHLHRRLVHADGRRQHAGADVRHVRELEQALDRAVFAVRAVQHGKDDVEAEAGDDRAVFAAIDREERVAARLRDEMRFARRLGQLFLAARWMTSAATVIEGGRAGSAHRPSFSIRMATGQVPLGIEVLNDRGRRRQRHFVFAGSAAVDDADAQFFHQLGLNLARVVWFPGHAHRRPRARRRAVHRARRRRDAGVHARRDAGRRQRRHASRSRVHRRRDPAEQHLSSVSASRRRPHRAPRRSASFHRLEQADSDRQRRLSGVQPRRAPDDHRRGRALPLASRRLRASADAGEARPTSSRSSARTSRWCSTSVSRCPPTLPAVRDVDGADAALGMPRARSISRAARRRWCPASSRPIPARRSSASCRAACIPTYGKRARNRRSRSASRRTRSAA